MNKALWRVLLPAIAVMAIGAVLAFWFLSARDDKDHDEAEERPIVAPSRLVRENGQTFVLLDRDAREKAGIATILPTAGRLQRSIASFGTVVEPAEMIETSAFFGEGKAKLAAAEARLTASGAAWQRAKELYDDGKSFSLAQLQAAEEAYRSDQAGRNEAAAHLRALTEAARQNWGELLARNIAEESSLARDLREGKSLLVRVAIPGVEPPPAGIFLSWEGGGAIEASLIALLPKIDPRFQQRLALYAVSGAQPVAPGATVGASLPRGEACDGALIPSSAVLWAEGEAWVYREIAEGRFRRDRIGPPESQPDGRVFIAALPTDKPVVARGAQILLSEEAREHIQVGEEGRSK